MRNWVLIGLGLVTAGVFGWLTVRKVDWPAAGLALSDANWRLLALCVPLLGSSTLLRALRWQVILRGQAGARFGPLVLAAGVGLGANAILPGKLGEAVGAHALGRLADLSRIQSLGILIVTRLADLLVLFTLVLGATTFLPSPALRSLRNTSGVTVAALALVLLLPLMLRLEWGKRQLARLREQVERRLGPGVLDVLGKFARGLASAGRVWLLAAFVLSTGLLWAVLSLSLLVALRAFNIQVPAAYTPLIMGLIAVSAMLPAAPGNVGTVHYFGLVALGLVGVAPGLAGACIIAYHALDLVSALVIGAVCGAIARDRLALWRTPAQQVLETASAPADGLLRSGFPLEPLAAGPELHPAARGTPALAAEEA